MIDTHQLKSLLVDKIEQVQDERFEYEEVFAADNEVNGKNEFLFFIKPEITLKSDSIKLPAILDMFFDKIYSFGLNIVNVKVLSAKYLEENNIIAQHYGVINSISKNAKAGLSDTAKAKFKALFGKSADEANLYGSLEFIKAYPEFTPLALDHLWQNGPFEKLAGGTYVQKLMLDGIEAFVVNGFHPRQLAHFTDAGRSIVTFTLRSDISWEDARQKFIGATNPASASEGSIRRELLNKKDELGLQMVSSSWNGVHLSAGPVEGLIELARYNSDFAENKLINPEDLNFGKQLSSVLTQDQLQSVLSNTDVNVDGKSISIFDLTEEKDSDTALTILKETYN